MPAPSIPALNDGSQRPPALRVFINMGNVDTLPATSTGPRGDQRSKLLAIKAAGYQGVQGDQVDPALCRELGLGCATQGRFNRVAEVGPGVAAAKAAGFDCMTVHVGWGHEADAEVDALVQEVIAVSAREVFPVFIETHRATVTQDTWRTVELVRRNPEVRFNGDFSHWYSGLEMPYGDLEEKWTFLAPVFARVRFFHGRMGNSSHIQVPLADPSMVVAVGHFRTMWIRAMKGFIAAARPGDYLIFTPELLHPEINYARTMLNAAGERVEESDRWQEALEYARIARACFAEAQGLSSAAASAERPGNRSAP